MRTKTLLALSFVAAPLVGCTGQPSSVGTHNEAALVSPDLVIAEVFAGNTGTTFTEDYVVLFNRGTAAASTSGLSLFYKGALSTTNTTLALDTFSVPAGGHLLVSMGVDSTTGALTPDQTGLTNLSTTGGRIALAGAGFDATDATTWTDLVGWGTSDEREGTTLANNAPAMSTTTADIRAEGGCTDTGVNSADFTAGTPTQKNSASTAAPCSATSTPDMTVVPADMTTTGGPDGSPIIEDLAGTTPADDLAVTASNVDGGDPTGNQPSATNGTAPTYTPGGSIPGSFTAGGGRGLNGCNVGGHAASTPWLAGLLIAGFALAFRRRRTA